MILMLMFTHSATAMIYYVIHLWNTCVPYTLAMAIYVHEESRKGAPNTVETHKQQQCESILEKKGDDSEKEKKCSTKK